MARRAPKAAKKDKETAAAAAPVRTWRENAIGIFIAVHLTAITLKAIPTPEDGMVRETWQDPTVQTELHAWWDRIKALGFHDLTYPQWEDFLWDVAAKYCDLRYWVLRPFQPYYTYGGTYQAWPMFIAPQRYPTRFSIDAEIDGNWVTEFTEADPEHAWMGESFGDTRFRSVFFRFAFPTYAGELSQFADWVARRAAHDFPSATKVRVRMVRYRSPSPEEALAGTPIDGTTRVIERDLEGLR